MPERDRGEDEGEHGDPGRDKSRPERLQRLREQGVRDDVPLETIAIFLGLVANGLALRVTVDDPIPDLDLLAELVETGVAPRGPR